MGGTSKPGGGRVTSCAGCGLTRAADLVEPPEEDRSLWRPPRGGGGGRIRTVNPLERARDQAGTWVVGPFPHGPQSRPESTFRPHYARQAAQAGRLEFSAQTGILVPILTSDSRDRVMLIRIKSEFGPLAVARLPLFGNFSYSA